jgi:hypothetical protein
MALKKDEFLEKMRSQLDELNYRWNIERNKLEAQAQHVSAGAQKKLDEEIENFRKLRTDLKAKMADLETASENAWDDVKEGSETAWNALSDAFKKATNHFK